MKKVFACLSAIALMLVAFGLVMQPAKVSAAEVEEGKFIVDPTLEEGDIPIYVMNSIYTTFPSLYDNNALKDPNYGLGRDYYWNEIKLVVPKFENNAATGERYTVYTQGTYSASKKTAANTKIYCWTLDGEGNPVPSTYSASGHSYSADGYGPLFGDQSLSGVRYNVSGKEVVMENLYTVNGIANMASTTESKYAAGNYSSDPFYMIFDGQGKAVRGAAHDNYYVKENQEATGFVSLFGYVDGKIVVREDVVGGAAVNGFGATDAELDREQIAVPNPEDPVLDDFGEPVLDAEGNPMYNDMYVDGEGANVLFGKRYLWQWYSEEDFASQKVNTAQYMQEGWLADRWDYAYADPNGGYVCLKFVASLGKYAVITAEESKVHNDSVRAALAAGTMTQEEHDALLIAETVNVDEETGVETISYDTFRSPVILKVVVPVDGIMYRYGYLDYSGAAVVDMHFGKFCPLFQSAMLYGRHSDYQAYARTYNFTATGLVAKNVVVDGVSFIVREESGKYVVEVKEGTTITPSKIVDILGMLGGYGIAGVPSKEAGSNVAAVVSYKQSEATELEYTMDIDGIPTMRPIQYMYENVQVAIEAFLEAFAPIIGVSGDVASWSSNSYGKITDDKVAEFFDANADWAWFKDFYEAIFNEAATASGFSAYTAWAPNGVRFGIPMLYAGAKHGSWPYSPDFGVALTTDINDYQPEKAYRFNTWEDFVSAFLVAIGEQVYGNAEKFPTAVSFWDNSYTADATIQAKMCEFFQTGEWKWLGDEIAAGVAKANWTSYANTHYYYYRTNVYEYITKTKKTNWPASCGSFHEMADPAWIGVPLEKDYNKVTFSTAGMPEFKKFDLTLNVVNKATGISDSETVTFQIVKEFTPVIRIDEAALRVAVGQKSIDLSKAVKAYDATYIEGGNGVYGSDISRQYLEFVYPEGFDPNNLKAGVHTVKAIAKCPNETGITETAEFVVSVPDVTAPEIRLVNRGDLYVPVGTQLTADHVLVYAYDDAHGDLMRNADVNWNWLVINTDYVADTAMVGESFTGTVTVADATGNVSTGSIRIIVTGVTVPEIEIPEVPQPVDPTEPTQESCISFAYVSSFIAAAGLALLVFKKRH